MIKNERTNPPGEGGLIHLGMHQGYTFCRIFIPDLPEGDRHWIPPWEWDFTPENATAIAAKLPGTPITCPHCLAGKPAPICSTDPRLLRMWTIYERPRDYPEGYVAREWRIVPQRTEVSIEKLVAPTLDEIRSALDARLKAIGRGGLAMLVRVARSPQDEPQIVETWM